MTAHLTITPEVVELGELLADGAGEAEPAEVVLANSGDTLLRDLTVAARGRGAHVVQFSPDGGRWAQTGEPLRVPIDELEPGAQVSVWARAAYTPADAEGRYEFTVLVNGTSW